MIRLHMIAEGQTEEGFCNTVLFPHLEGVGIEPDVRLTWHGKRSTPKARGGGAKSYQSIRGDILRWMKEDSNAWFTTMFDLYGIPSDFPGLDSSRIIRDPYEKIAALESAFGTDICAADAHLWRFIPHLQLHEFESLLFSDPKQFDWEFIEPRHVRKIEELVNIANEFGNPEAINDGANTAPSKRIIEQIPEYRGRKPSAGPLIAAKIGLPRIRKHCAHFDRWLTRLEKLGIDQYPK